MSSARHLDEERGVDGRRAAASRERSGTSRSEERARSDRPGPVEIRATRAVATLLRRERNQRTGRRTSRGGTTRARRSSRARSDATPWRTRAPPRGRRSSGCTGMSTYCARAANVMSEAMPAACRARSSCSMHAKSHQITTSPSLATRSPASRATSRRSASVRSAYLEVRRNDVARMDCLPEQLGSNGRSSTFILMEHGGA